jgi:hypothetical protein
MAATPQAPQGTSGLLGGDVLSSFPCSTFNVNGLRVLLIGLTACNRERTPMERRPVHLWSARAPQAVIRRLPAATQPRRARYCSHHTAFSSTAFDIRHGHREKACAFLKTRNRLNKKRKKKTHTPLSMESGSLPVLRTASRRRLKPEAIKGLRGPRLHDTSYQSHDERPWTLRGGYTPIFGHRLDTARLSESYI